MTINPTQARTFNTDILQPRLDEVTICVADIITNHRYSYQSQIMPVLYSRLVNHLESTMDILRVFFSEIAGVEREVDTGVSVQIHRSFYSLLSTHMNMRNLFTILLNIEITDISSYDAIIASLNELMYIASEQPRVRHPSVATFNAVAAQILPKVRRNRHKSKALPKAEIEKTMEDPFSICFESYTRANSVSTCCNHYFCKDCYASHEKSVTRGKMVSCPLCRKENPVVTEYRARKTRVSKNANKVIETETAV